MTSTRHEVIFDASGLTPTGKEWGVYLRFFLENKVTLVSISPSCHGPYSLYYSNEQAIKSRGCEIRHLSYTENSHSVGGTVSRISFTIRGFERYPSGDYIVSFHLSGSLLMNRVSNISQLLTIHLNSDRVVNSPLYLV